LILLQHPLSGIVLDSNPSASLWLARFAPKIFLALVAPRGSYKDKDGGAANAAAQLPAIPAMAHQNLPENNKVS
jgi:hypothetical protein